ncbi:MAG: hypothetical protein V5A76_07855, partial [Candidatus Thermoplasmatota archaeon]
KTCIKARRLYNETKQDEALQKRKQMMDKQTREKKTEQDITPERPKRRRDTQNTEIEEKSPINALEGEKTDKTEEKDFLDTLEERAFKNKAEEESLVDTIEEENATEKLDEKGLIETIEEESSTDQTEEKGLVDAIEEGSQEKVEEKGSVETLEPNSIIEMENLQGSIEDIRNDPTKPTDTWLETKEEEGDSLFKTDFPNPPDKLQSGEGKQEFLVRVRRTEDEFFFPPYPEVNVKICEDGNIVKETGAIEIEDIHGEVVSLTWDAGKLFDLYGTDVELVVEGFGAGDEGTQNRIEIGAVGWLANLVESTKGESSNDQTLEEKLLSPLGDESQDETIDAIQSDINPLE